MSEVHAAAYVLATNDTEKLVPIYSLSPGELKRWLQEQPARMGQWLHQQNFEAAPGAYSLLPDESGNITAVVVGKHPEGGLRSLQDLPGVLPVADYYLPEEQTMEVYLGWGLAAYKFDRYIKSTVRQPRLQLPVSLQEQTLLQLEATCLVRDLVNTPTQDMGPADLSAVAEQLAQRYDADFEEIVGADLLNSNHPAIHAVGRAATVARAPRLVRLSWGLHTNPLVALVGKGVCFDTGGLDIKPASGMLRMKKDMGGAAHALALAQLVMGFKLPVRLELFIPAVENAISADAYRPGDVVHTRKGLSVEIGNTDAEGRVVLADALSHACEFKPDLVLDFATLTGAARVALGPDLPPIFANKITTSSQILNAGVALQDPLWSMPLHQPYASALKSTIADVNNITSGLMGAGALTAALFLQKFVSAQSDWVHIDTYAWNDNDRPGRPTGGEAMGLRAVFASLLQRYQ